MKRPRGYGAVFLRGRIWWYRCRPGMKPESSKSTVRKDAEDMLQARLDELRLRQGPAADTTGTTYEDLERALLADLRASGRRSLENVEKFRLPHLRRIFAGKLARAINYDLVNVYIGERLKGAKPATVSIEVKLLKRMFVLAHRSEMVYRVPTLPTVAVGDNARKGFATPEQIEKVIAHLPEHAKAPVRALYLTGWRTGEILGLEWRQVDFEEGMIRLPGEKSKSGKPRAFPFKRFPQLAALLREQLAVTKAWELKRGAICPHVFHDHGQRFDSFRTAWRNAVKEAGLPGLTAHDMRRSAARNLLGAGVPENAIMRLCGWSTRSMFDRYAIASMGDLEEGVEKLGAFLAGQTGPAVEHLKTSQAVGDCDSSVTADTVTRGSERGFGRVEKRGKAGGQVTVRDGSQHFTTRPQPPGSQEVTSSILVSSTNP